MAPDLRRIRLERGLSLAEVARRSGLAAPNVSRAERPDVDPRLTTVERILAASGLRLTTEPIPREDAVERLASIGYRVRH